MGIRIEITRGGKMLAPRSRRTRRLLASLLVLGVLGSGAGLGSYAAFTATTGNAGNSFAAGSVAIQDNDNATALLSLANAKPGDSDTKCIQVEYKGSLASTVRLYGAVSGSLANYLTLTVTRGTGGGAFPSCTGFAADGTNYIGQGNGVVYSGNLSAFPADWAAGLGHGGNWASNETRTYRFVVTLQDNNAAQSATGSAGFTWEARNA
jgi:hypothetical protein